MAHQRKPNTLELRLVIRYSGIKATQYFSKFTPESDKVFRDDILALKLPHPKRENTNFLSHGSVECFWPETQRNGVRMLLLWCARANIRMSGFTQARCLKSPASNA